MPITKKHRFDEVVVGRINDYISKNNLSLNKIADATGMTYAQLYQMTRFNQTIKLREYVALCRAFNEPFERFIDNLKDEDLRRD